MTVFRKMPFCSSRLPDPRVPSQEAVCFREYLISQGQGAKSWHTKQCQEKSSLFRENNRVELSSVHQIMLGFKLRMVLEKSRNEKCHMDYDVQDPHFFSGPACCSPYLATAWEEDRVCESKLLTTDCYFGNSCKECFQ